MKGFCYRCGYEGELLDGLCNKCYSQLNPLFNITDEVRIEACHMCGSYKRKNWQDPREKELDDILQEMAYSAVKDNIKVNNKNIDIEIIPLEPQQLPGGKKSRVVVPTKIIAEGKLLDEKENRIEEKEIVVHILMVQCPRCSRYMSNYYEAILQVRAMNRYLTEEEREELDNFVRDEVDKRMKKDRMAFISKFIPQKEGLDYQIGSMGGARYLASTIKSKYGGKTYETAKLVGVEKDTGKDMYRITVVVRIPEYTVGDIIKYNKSAKTNNNNNNNIICRVVSMNENKIYLESLLRRDKISLVWSDAEKNTTLLKKVEECQTATVISVSPTTIMAMDNENYEIYEYDNIFNNRDNKNKNIREGDILKIYKDETINYIIEELR
jgi:nonsense-mediated mRNA decay protein 3